LFRMNMLGLCQVYLSHIYHDIQNSSFYNTYKSFVRLGFAKHIMPILFSLCYNGSLVTWTVLGLAATKFKPLQSQSRSHITTDCQSAFQSWFQALSAAEDQFLFLSVSVFLSMWDRHSWPNQSFVKFKFNICA
jgi:hypothetical protein